MKRTPSAVNALIAVNKPVGITSHDAVSRVRRAVGERRVGHAGTLDPAASGVLVMGIGQATRLLGLVTLDRKGYVARVALGSETTTDDNEGEVTAMADVDERFLDEGLARAALAGFVGEQDQVPPTYSAVSVDGRRAYDRARAGEEVVLAPRHVTVHSAELVGIERGENPCWIVALDVSKGTYVRSIARDLGRELGCYAHLDALVRTFSGPVALGACLELADLDAGGAALARERALDPVATLGLAARAVADSELDDVRNGRRISCGWVADAASQASASGRDAQRREPAEGVRVCLGSGGGLLGIWVRWGGRLVCETNFPQAIEGVRR